MFIAFTIGAIFNYTSIKVTAYSNAFTRSILEVTRIVFVWVVSLIIGWEDFYWL